jgi:hypothetical protein
MSGASYVKFIKAVDFNFQLFFYLFIFIFLTDPVWAGSVFKKGFLTRAPPIGI